MIKNSLLSLLLGIALCFPALAQMNENTIVNGIPWFDQNGNIVNAHGACIVEEGGLYYLFGEWKSDESNAFPGFSCYSSSDLVHWNFERVALPLQKDGLMGPNRVGERVKVMKCPKTGEYVMYMHSDDMSYKDPHVAYATSKTINGEYTFQGALLFDGKPINKWDMGTFQDADGKGYLLIHGGYIYQLSDDYRSIQSRILNGLSGTHGESPALFKLDGLYYFLFSNLTSWEKNDNFYYTATSLEGPWTSQGLLAPKGMLTYNSQTTFVCMLNRNGKKVPMFMGDRWSYPHQASAATYVWMPLQVDGTKLSMPTFWNAWDIQTLEPVDALAGGKVIPFQKISFSADGDWQKNESGMASRVKGSYFEVSYSGQRLALVGENNPQSGYARVYIYNKKGEEVYTSLVDFYSKYANEGLRFITPELPKGKYTLKVEVTGIHPVWTDKSKTIYGSTDDYVTLQKVVILPKK